MKQLESLVIAFSMYSKVPMPKVNWTKENMRFSMCYFPLVGIFCGGLALLWYYMALVLGVGEIFRAVLFTLIPVFVTGGIHMDGFLDTVDALSSWQSPEKRLEILKDPNSGAFAVLFCGVYLLSYAAIWSEIEEAQATGVLAVSFLYSRALSGFSVTRFCCAKNSGLVATFANMSDKKRAGRILGAQAFLYGAAMLLVDWRYGAAAVLAGLAVFAYYRSMSYRKFGGITGDIAGYFLQLCEIAMAFAVMIVQKVV